MADSALSMKEHRLSAYPVTLAVAVAAGRVMGWQNQMPWHLPQDLRYFRQLTWGKAVIMGRRTWDSLPETFRPLPGRFNIVVSRQTDFRAAGATVVPDLLEAMALAQHQPLSLSARQAQAFADLDHHLTSVLSRGSVTRAEAEAELTKPMIIGGGQLYAAAIDYAQTLFMTELEATYPGDTFFPELSHQIWQECDRQSHVTENGLRFHWLVYPRR